jgi:hypothetical protein
MSIVSASVIVVATTTVAIAAMLLVRRRAPPGSYFADGDRAAGVFGVLATGFALVSGFVIFLAFESYDTSRSGAETEARIVGHQFETVQFLPTRARERLSGELVCYGRSVVHDEWPRMTSGSLGNAPNRWGVVLFRSLQATEARSASEQTAFAKYLDERSDREDARADRTHGAEGAITEGWGASGRVRWRAPSSSCGRRRTWSVGWRSRVTLPARRGAERVSAQGNGGPWRPAASPSTPARSSALCRAPGSCLGSGDRGRR